MTPSLYIITAYQFNHNPCNSPSKPLDQRFLESKRNLIYYLIDTQVPQVLQNKQLVIEKELDPLLYTAGGRHFGEWSFLLAEAKHAFCSYPLFMISSRFYDKNSWLLDDLDRHWDQLFSYFDTYGWGYLPSYDRPLRWIDLSWKKNVEREVWKYKFFPFTARSYELVKEVFGVNIPNDYRYTSDLFCNYIGFKSREHLLRYVDFYRPLIDRLFDTNYQPKEDLSFYIRPTGAFRNEKPFTFLLELLCHLFFFKSGEKLFALHYDGYYEVDERHTKKKKLLSFPIPFDIRLERRLRWTWHQWNTEGFLTPIRQKLKI